MPVSTPDVASTVYRGALYRALNPLYAAQPLSGRGAAMFGGRFNARGTPALYTSTSPEGAIRESNQVGSLQPTVLVSYEADIGPVFDTRDAAAMAARGATSALIEDAAWRDRMLRGDSVPTQNLAARLIADGYVGLRVRSFAKGARATDMNLVLWSWDATSLRVIDDENRLRREPV